MPTLTWLESFQHQNSTTTSYGTNAGTWDNSQRPAGQSFVIGRRSNSLALQLVEDGVTATNVGKTLAAGNRVLVESFYIKISATPSVDSNFWNASATLNASMGMSTATGTIYYSAGSGSNKLVTGNWADGLWHRIDVKFVTSATPYTLDLSVDGVAQTQQVSNATTAADITTSRFGSTGPLNTLTCQFADFVRSVTTGDFPIGPHRVLALVPAVDGTHNWASTNMGDSTGGRLQSITDLNTMVDDWPANTTDYIAYTNTTATSTEYAEITLPDVDTGLTVWAARAVAAIFSSATQANSATTRVVDGAGTTVLNLYVGDQSDTNLRYQASLLPSINTPAKLNALKFRVGFPTDSNPAPRWSALMVDYAILGDQYPQAVGATVTATPGATRNTGKPVPSAVTVTPAQTRGTGKVVAAAATGTVALLRTKLATQVIAAIVSLTAAVVRRIGKLVAAATTVTAVVDAAFQSGSHATQQAIAATTTLTVAMVRKTGKLVAAAVTFMLDVFQGVSTGVQVFFRVNKPVAATTTVTANVARSLIAKLIAASSAITAALAGIKVSLKTIAATTSLTVALRRNTGKVIVVATTLAAVLARKVGKQISGSTTLGVGLARRTGKLVTATATLAVDLVRRTAKTIAAGVTGTIGLAAHKVTTKLIAATTTLGVSVSRVVSHAVAMAISVAFDVVVVRGVGKVLDVAVVVGVELQRVLGKTIEVALDMGAFVRAVSSRLAHGFRLKIPSDAETTAEARSSATGGDGLDADTDEDLRSAALTGTSPWDADTGEGR